MKRKKRERRVNQKLNLHDGVGAEIEKRSFFSCGKQESLGMSGRRSLRSLNNPPNALKNEKKQKKAWKKIKKMKKGKKMKIKVRKQRSEGKELIKE